MKIFELTICIFVCYIQSSVSSTLERQKELIRIMRSIPNNTWVAGHEDRNITVNRASYLPSSFDARQKWGSLYNEERCPALGRVVNNGKCNFYCIKTPLSAQHLISCCEDCCSCNGGDVILGWEYVKNKGLVTGGPWRSNIGCQPFSIPPCERPHECSSENSEVLECSMKKCSKTNIMESPLKIADYYSLSRYQPTKIMNDLMEFGPLQVSMHMYEDFRFYTEGIYAHKYGDFVSDHGVKLIGWGITDEGQKYWLLINSFGRLWGEDGLFKISMFDDNTDFGYSIIAPIL